MLKGCHRLERLKGKVEGRMTLKVKIRKSETKVKDNGKVGT